MKIISRYFLDETFLATLGGFALGTVIGWSSPANSLIKDLLKVNDEDISWVSSIMPIGAACSQLYMALTLDLFGCRLSMLIIAIPFVIGWLMLAFAQSIAMFCVARFITGFCGGSFCVAAPTFIGEIADKGVRGTLSVFFQLLLVNGILVSYALGEFQNLHILTLPLIVGPALVFIIVIFLPESAVFYNKKGKPDEAKKSMQYYRGNDYNIDAEMKEIDEYTKSSAENFWERFKTRACIKAFVVLLVMHAVQQLSGINAVMFFAHDIFEMAGSTMSAGANAIILAVVQVALTGLSAYLVDKSGRRLLWVVSLSLMCICLVVMGIYFTIQRSNPENAKEFAWLPLVVICIYLAGFSLGTGPLPWAMIGEFLPNSVKTYIGPFIASFNWLLAFAITKSFIPLKDALGADIVFWIYAVICGLGLIFVVLFLLETKNKTLEEIQLELSN